MTIDVPTEYEDILRRAVASGAFDDERAALLNALELFAKKQRGSSIERLPTTIDIDDLADKQAVQPFRADRTRPSLWPQDDSIDDFLVFLQETRQDSAAGASQ